MHGKMRAARLTGGFQRAFEIRSANDPAHHGATLQQRFSAPGESTQTGFRQPSAYGPWRDEH